MIQIANAPCSWGALEFELEGKSLGYEQVLSEMVETGYAGTELGDWGFMPSVPKELNAVLVDVYVVWYPAGHGELINTQNRLYPEKTNSC